MKKNIINGCEQKSEDRSQKTDEKDFNFIIDGFYGSMQRRKFFCFRST